MLINSKYVIVAGIIVGCLAATGYAQSEKKSVSPFSHKGIKAMAALGGLRVNGNEKLDDGQTVALGLGYGFSSRTTLWLALTGAEHSDEILNDAVTEFDGVELSFQYKFVADSPLQPYAKVGAGVYQVKRRGSNLSQQGGGFNVALGADYFFSRHVGLGVELNFKDIRYQQQRLELPGDDIVTDLEPEINRDTKGVMITLTLQ